MEEPPDNPNPNLAPHHSPPPPPASSSSSPRPTSSAYSFSPSIPLTTPFQGHAPITSTHPDHGPAPSTSLTTFSDPRPSWRDICGVIPKLPAPSRRMTFAPPVLLNGEKVAFVDEQEATTLDRLWESTLVFYVLGKRPYRMHLLSFIERVWMPKGEMKLYARPNGFFYLKLSSEEECQRILAGGPWLFQGRFMAIRRWEEGISLERDLLSEVPLWVRLHGLSLGHASDIILNKLASIIGTPLFMDAATAAGLRDGYARCCISVHVEKVIPSSVPLVFFSGKRETIGVEVEWQPPRCNHCISFGHNTGNCPYVNEASTKLGTTCDSSTLNIADQGQKSTPTNVSGTMDKVHTQGEEQMDPPLVDPIANAQETQMDPPLLETMGNVHVVQASLPPKVPKRPSSQVSQKKLRNGQMLFAWSYFFCTAT